MSYEDARAEREFRQNPPESAPGQDMEDDGWGDLYPKGSSSVEPSPTYDSNVNSVLNDPSAGVQNNTNPNPMGNTQSTEDKLIELSIIAGKGVFSYLKALAKSLKNNTGNDWHNLGVRISLFSLVACLIGLFFSIINIFTKANTNSLDLVIGGLLSMTVGIVLCMFFDKDPNAIKEVDLPEPEATEKQVDWESILVDEDEAESTSSYVENYEEEDEDASIWSSILGNDTDYGVDTIEDYGTSVDSENFSVEEAISEVREIAIGTQTRQYLFETFCSVLPKVTPGYATMHEISVESDIFFMFEDYLRGAAFQVGTKEENIPELISLHENPFVYRLSCTRPIGLKEQAIADEIASTYCRDDNNKVVKHGVYATIETSVGKYTINVFKGFEEDMNGDQIGGVQISLGDIFGQIQEFICNPKIEVPFVWGVNEYGDTLYCDMKDNNSIIISGEPRGGKSWKGQSFVAQLAMFHSPKEIEFYIFDGKDKASDYKYLSTVLPHVKYFCGDMDKINQGIKRVLDKMVEERGRIITEAGFINIKDYNKANPDKKLPYAYIIIDELASLMNHFVETDQKEEGVLFKSFLSTMVTKLPYTGIKFVLFPHRIVNDVIPKNTYSLVSCRAVVNQTNVDELKNAVQVNEKQFPYKLVQKGDMALKIKEIAGGEVVFCHAEMLSSSNQSNKKLFEYIGAVWKKLEPDCECITMKGMTGGEITIDRGNIQLSKERTPIDHTKNASEYDYKGYSNIANVFEDESDLDVDEGEEEFWKEFL